MGNVFISYRRDDAAGYARAIYDQLTERFDTAQVFMDVDAIEPGLPFDEVIRNAVGKCEVLLVLIGSRWMEVQPDGRRRLDDERDFVRLEIAAALARNIRVIPVLLDGVQMPAEELLPEPMRGLVWRNALEVSNTRFTSDVNRLGDVLARVLGEAEEGPAERGQAERPASASAEVVSTHAPTGADRRGAVKGAVPTGSATAAAGDARDVGGKGGKGSRIALVAGAVVVAGAIAAVLLWPDRRPPVVVPDKPKPELALGLPDYGVVFGSDRTLDAARDEIRRASRSSVQGAAIYFRNGYYASIAPADTRAEADRILGIVRAFRSDAYATRMETWCRQPTGREGYIECASTAGAP